MLSAVTFLIGRLTSPLWRPMVGRRWLPIWAMVHHRGRRSGRAYATPVQIRTMGPDHFVIAVPWPERSQWFRNVLAAGGCTLTWRGAEHRTDAPTLITASEAAPAYTRLERFLIRLTGLTQFLRLHRAA
jgi:deazaflavin-dependent oxidoreductase (nitroreductase family)